MNLTPRWVIMFDEKFAVNSITFGAQNYSLLKLFKSHVLPVYQLPYNYLRLFSFNFSVVLFISTKRTLDPIPSQHSSYTWFAHEQRLCYGQDLKWNNDFCKAKSSEYVWTTKFTFYTKFTSVTEIEFITIHRKCVKLKIISRLSFHILEKYSLIRFDRRDSENVMGDLSLLLHP